jgi:hypothetical protein
MDADFYVIPVKHMFVKEEQKPKSEKTQKPK